MKVKWKVSGQQHNGYEFDIDIDELAELGDADIKYTVEEWIYEDFNEKTSYRCTNMSDIIEAVRLYREKNNIDDC